jgi:hypothetical protein
MNTYLMQRSETYHNLYIIIIIIIEKNTENAWCQVAERLFQPKDRKK